MASKYQIHNQLTGLQEEAPNYAEAKILQERIRSEYMATIEGLFAITVLVQNSDGSWTQSLCDENGIPISPPASLGIPVNRDLPLSVLGDGSGSST